ncbi:MAG: hypothetical protein KDK45_25175 [Leptospiraceae bacterium]|nr:hypothetical protein [Leptospiraceae bacterium]
MIKILCFLTTALTLAVGCDPSDYQVPQYEKLADKITDKIGKKLEEKKHLKLVGTGGQMMDDIQMMGMSFFYYHEVSLEESRELLVYAIRKYLKAINANEQIRPYLHEYPFTDKNVEIMIWFYNPDRSNLPSDKIYHASIIGGKMNYYIEGKNKYSRISIQTESYEEALKAVTTRKKQ